MVKILNFNAILPIKLLLAGLAVTMIAAGAHAEVFQGRVIRISDGDSFILQTKSQLKIRVRLAEIDAPERNQPWGRHARLTLKNLIMGKNVVVQIQSFDHYGRTIGSVVVARADGGLTDVNATMARWGEAWAFTRYLTDQRIAAEAAAAKAARRGLWSLPPEQRQPPWEWRKKNDSSRKNKKKTAPFWRAWFG